jgi:hypothetical protein
MRLAVNPDHDSHAFWRELNYTAHAVLVRLLEEGRVTVPDQAGADALQHAARMPGWRDEQGNEAIEAG